MLVSSRTVVAARMLARWATGFEARHLTRKARDQLVLSIRDGLGCAIFGSTLPWAIATRDALARAFPTHDASIWGTTLRLPGPPAALANGLAIHGFELDDFSLRVPGVHATASVLPAVLAIAESRGGVSGKDLLAALAVGHEVAVRLGLCMGWSMAQNGWHTPAIFGAIAAATAAGRALRLSEDQLVGGISIAALEASGLLAAKRRGMVKRLYAGHAAQIGLTAALLGVAGCDAPEDVFEGSGGFCDTYAADRAYDLDALTGDLGGESLAAEDIQFKLYAACGMVHAALDAVRDLQREAAAVTPDNIAEVEVGLSSTSVRFVGGAYVPDDVTRAQFSAQYAVAVTLIEGNASVDQFRTDLLDDPRVLALARRIRAVPEPSFDSDLASRNGGRVAIRLADERVLTRTYATARGSAVRPASEQELREKFDALAEPIIGRAAADALSRMVQSIEEVADAGVLSRMTAPSRSRSSQSL